MFDFAWSEMAVIAVVALVVIGPKDLPRVMRTVGMWVSRARGIAREFQSSLDQMIREAELDEMKKHVEKAASLDLGQEIQKTIDPGNELQKKLDEPVLSDPAPKPSETTPLETASSETTVPPPELLPAPEAEAKPAPPVEEAPAPNGEAAAKSDTHA